MAKKSAVTPAKTTEASDESILVTAAKAIGTAAGKVARLAGAGGGAPTPSQKIPKLVKKEKSKLPRKEKKAAKAKAVKKSAK